MFVRPGEHRQAEWDQIDFDTAELRYVSSRIKTPHIVPLASQALNILREFYRVTGERKHMFAGPRAMRPLSDSTLLVAMREVGSSQEKMTIHGFRAMARTILDEALNFRTDIIAHQLAHTIRDPNGRAYNRTAHLPERKIMMQQLAVYRDKLRLRYDEQTGKASE